MGRRSGWACDRRQYRTAALRIANRYLRTPYAWTLLSSDGAAVTDDNGISIQPQGAIHDGQSYGSVILCADIQPERYHARELRR